MFSANLSNLTISLVSIYGTEEGLPQDNFHLPHENVIHADQLMDQALKVEILHSLCQAAQHFEQDLIF